MPIAEISEMATLACLKALRAESTMAWMTRSRPSVAGVMLSSLESILP